LLPIILKEMMNMFKKLQNIFGKNSTADCCNIEIKEVKAVKNDCCGIKIEEVKEEDKDCCSSIKHPLT
jgi:hypothetical protein